MGDYCSSPYWERWKSDRVFGKKAGLSHLHFPNVFIDICIFHANVYKNIFYQTMTSLSLGGSWFGHTKNSLRED